MTEDDVIRAHTLAFNGALKSKDWGALSEIYSDDYMLVRPDGSVLSKEEVLRDLQAGGLTFHSIDITGVRVRIHGDTALLTGESRTVTSRGTDEAKAHVRLIAVYVAHGDALQLTHFQSVSLPE
jgi:ketosteroid isomerase-like protein